MATSGGIFAPIALRAFKHVFKKTTNLIKARIAEASRSVNHELQPILVRNAPRQAIHPAARLRQAKGRWYTTHSTINASFRRFMSKASENASKYSRAEFPSSSTARAVSRLTTRAPFASTLRPNLTGGAFPRTAGGYSLGGGRAGGARYFSHTPTAPAQVINNVSAAVRAFWISGQQARFDGATPQGEKRYRAVSSLQQEIARKMQGVSGRAPRAGSFIDFPVNPAISALTPVVAFLPLDAKVAQEMPNLNTDGFLDCLAVDFSRALKDLAMTMNDLKRLSTLGDLPISLESKSILRVRFPGCDAETVERLCNEVGIQRGVISQDSDYHEDPGAHLALMFPFAPQSNPSLSRPDESLQSQTGGEELYDDIIDDIIENPWMEGYGSISEISGGESAYFSRPTQYADSSDFEGLEGIYRFLEHCDNSRRIP